LLRSARAAALRGDFEAAVADALGAVKKGERERGRAACVRLFEALGHAHPLTVSGRKKLSNVWFL
jgi:thioredoxin-like negative regulator of GroEL